MLHDVEVQKPQQPVKRDRYAEAKDAKLDKFSTNLSSDDEILFSSML